MVLAWKEGELVSCQATANCMRILIAAALAAMATPAMADIAIVCERPWAGDIERLEVSVADDGKPTIRHTISGGAVGDFAIDPDVLGYATTQTAGSGTPFSSIMIESRAVDGTTWPARVIYVDWGRVKVWMAFMSMLDEAGGRRIENCVRTD